MGVFNGITVRRLMRYGKTVHPTLKLDALPGLLPPHTEASVIQNWQAYCVIVRLSQALISDFLFVFLNKLLFPYRGSQGLTTPPCIASDVAIGFFCSCLWDTVKFKDVKEFLSVMSPCKPTSRTL